MRHTLPQRPRQRQPSWVAGDDAELPYVRRYPSPPAPQRPRMQQRPLSYEPGNDVRQFHAVPRHRSPRRPSYEPGDDAHGIQPPRARSPFDQAPETVHDNPVADNEGEAPATEWFGIPGVRPDWQWPDSMDVDADDDVNNQHRVSNEDEEGHHPSEWQPAGLRRRPAIRRPPPRSRTPLRPPPPPRTPRAPSRPPPRPRTPPRTPSRDPSRPQREFDDWYSPSRGPPPMYMSPSRDLPPRYSTLSPRPQYRTISVRIREPSRSPSPQPIQYVECDLRRRGAIRRRRDDPRRRAPAAPSGYGAPPAHYRRPEPLERPREEYPPAGYYWREPSYRDDRYYRGY
ncbi:hypothetical protein G7054_g10648 [Neopestalotiopsis clavispora]|nr:hypothetical protein G7054_g10648 [Neopestalotiopsis clavispora]